MESSRLLKKYFLERRLLELEKHHVREDQNGNLSELETTKGGRISWKLWREFRGDKSGEFRLKSIKRAISETLIGTDMFHRVWMRRFFQEISCSNS